MKSLEPVPAFVAFVLALLGIWELVPNTPLGSAIGFALSWVAAYPLARLMWLRDRPVRHWIALAPTVSVVWVVELLRARGTIPQSADRPLGILVAIGATLALIYAAWRRLRAKDSEPER